MKSNFYEIVSNQAVSLNCFLFKKVIMITLLDQNATIPLKKHKRKRKITLNVKWNPNKG